MLLCKVPSHFGTESRGVPCTREVSVDAFTLVPTDSPQLKVTTFSHAEIYFSFQNLVLNVGIIIFFF